jgi:hypothetical protein
VPLYKPTKQHGPDIQHKHLIIFVQKVNHPLGVTCGFQEIQSLPQIFWISASGDSGAGHITSHHNDNYTAAAPYQPVYLPNFLHHRISSDLPAKIRGETSVFGSC